MVTVNARFDGKVFVPDDPLALKPNQRVRIQVEPIEQHDSTQSGSKRQLGLQRGAVIYIAPDFDAELGDEFWLGKDKRSCCSTRTPSSSTSTDPTICLPPLASPWRTRPTTCC